ncbi:MAG: A/G-specific adenine glycosylase, partial [Chloroflexota bacterium]
MPMSPARRPGPRPGPRPETRPSGTRPSGLGRSPRTVPGSVSPDLRDAILAWYPTRGRDLAFRGTTDPYAILVSEAMAQQTQAARAADYWSRFMHEFPTAHALAAASPAAVLRAWRGLGYNRRAIALRRAAIEIVRDHDGQVPPDLAALERLPGVGPYTARAVAALAFGMPVGAVDVNVRRVLNRAIGGSLDALSPRDLQSVADASVPADRPGEWTHALMDIGATFCKPREPRCADCPARVACRFGASAVVAGPLEHAGEPRVNRATHATRERARG